MTRIVLFFASTLALGATGCSNVNNAIDCNAVCDKYKSCFNSSYDTTACYKRCRDNSKDDAFEQSVSDCHDCIDDKSCASATFTCGAECSGVVP